MAETSRKSDLGVRLASATVMILVTGAALYIGGWVLTTFVALAGIVLLAEWWGLVRRFAFSATARLAWAAGGVVYIGTACVSLLFMPPGLRWLVILVVIAVDSCAYFAGRRFGRRKIAPSISPSKTWAGLYGGMAGATLVVTGAWLLIAIAVSGLGARPMSVVDVVARYPLALLAVMVSGCMLAVLAQAGDFFESWMKRRAGVKDSGTLLPGHGGLLDRIDGLIPVAIAAGILSSVAW